MVLIKVLISYLSLLHMDKDLAWRHYEVHKEKPFFEDLVKYITTATVAAAVLQGVNAVESIRKIMGPTDPAKAEAGTIRGDFGMNIEHNIIHGSDSN